MIQQNIGAIRSQIGDVKLIVVSKYRSDEELLEVYAEGQKLFAENRVQELLRKAQELPEDISWHLIGHLQSNKVRQIIPVVDLIHSVDSLKLLKVIQKEALKLSIEVSVLLQIHISTDETKFGFDPEDLISIAKSGDLNQFPNVRFKGIMSMSTLNASMEIVTSEFSKTRELFHKMKELVPEPEIFKELSMGMSGDYAVAIEQGSTMIRVGSKIFK